MEPRSARVVRVAGLALAAAVTVGAILVPVVAPPGDEIVPPLVVAELDEVGEDLVVVGQPVEIMGHARGSVLVFGGDVKIAGSVDGDVGAIGGSVSQTDTSHVTGDVLVVGGHYNHGDGKDFRAEGTNTLVFAGDSQSARDFFSNPARELLAPRIDRYYVGRRLFVILFSFLLALGVSALMSGHVSRASERLATDPARVAVLGALGTVAVLLTIALALVVLPSLVATLMIGPLLLLLLALQVFGRVVSYFFVGRWLQRRALGPTNTSQTTALVLGVVAVGLLGSLPVVGGLLLFAIFIVSIGLALTSTTLSGRLRR